MNKPQEAKPPRVQHFIHFSPRPGRNSLEESGEEYFAGTPRFRVLARESRGQYPKAGTQIKIGQIWPEAGRVACQNWPSVAARGRSMPHRAGRRLISCKCCGYAGTRCWGPRCNVGALLITMFLNESFVSRVFLPSQNTATCPHVLERELCLQQGTKRSGAAMILICSCTARAREHDQVTASWSRPF